jgi:hypothetical protein
MIPALTAKPSPIVMRRAVKSAISSLVERQRRQMSRCLGDGPRTENKTKPTDVDPRAFVDQVANAQRRQDSLELLALMQDLTGHPPKMWGPSIIGFDRYHYKYPSGREGDAPLTGFSPRSAELVLYLGPGLASIALTAKLGKHKAGKGCLYIKKLADIDRQVLRELIVTSVDALRKRYPRE